MIYMSNFSPTTTSTSTGTATTSTATISVNPTSAVVATPG